ncbi:MAG: hypothetical protein JKY56_09030 [Kofleriaceae bacterium]|nr:hypothetical protein [Kofleriaceae bacterium]
MEFQNFTSLPPEQEKAFVVFEQQSVQAGKKASMFGLIAGAVFGVFVIALVMTSEAPENAHAVKAPATKVGEAKKKAPAPKPAPAPVAAPAETAPAETAPDEAAPDEAAAPTEASAPSDAPAPPAGATKAPPTAVVGD